MTFPGKTCLTSQQERAMLAFKTSYTRDIGHEDDDETESNMAIQQEIGKALKKVFRPSRGGKTRLMMAVERECIDVIEHMLRTCDAHTEFFRLDSEGRTVLFYAAARGDCDILWALLRRLPGTGLWCARGSLLNIKDHHGELAEDVAETHGHGEAKHLLCHERIRIEYYE